jgi:hypothetical protein
MAGSTVQIFKGVRLAAGLLLAAMTMTSVAAGPKADKHAPPVRVTTLKFADIGAPTLAANVVAAGASIMTLNVLDSTHLLVTHAARKLIPRAKDGAANDDDRFVAAKVIELPSGKILATTEWHLRDHSRYLWPIGKGRFVLRIGSELSVFAPLASLAEPDPFLRVALPHQPGFPLGVTRSPEGEIISVISQVPPAEHHGPKIVLADGADNLPKPTYAIDFYRLKGDTTASSPLQVVNAGAVRADIPVILPMDADGYLWAEDDARGTGRWKVTFNDFNGKILPVGVIDSSCAPRMRLASRSELVAITCRGDETMPKLRSIGLDGHETWEEDFGAFLETPAFTFAPSAGRFVMSRQWTSTIGQSGSDPGVSTNNEEFRVYQTESGDMLLKVSANPLFHTPENFDLSEDGSTFAVINNAGIDVYSLPAPTKRDMEDLAEVAKFAPPASDGPVRLARMLPEPGGAALPATVATEQQALSVPLSTTTQAATSGQANLGDVAPTTNRKRPSLLNPGEKPEFKDKTAPPTP